MVSITVLMMALQNQGIPEKDITMMVCIANKESNLNPKAINKSRNKNGTKDHGLFQINDINKDLCDVTSKELLNVHKNIECAVKVYKTQNLKAWTTYKLCKEEFRRHNVRHDST